ncbi:MAG: hypothetical protein JEZ02_15970 [Desulfatibacillum sp.]|nr:hypothetical protein [Desulfatibacillum sp.]
MLSNIRQLEGRFPGMHRDSRGRHVKIVDRYVIHGNPMDFRDLCGRIVRADTKYLVLDLDGTFHKGLNPGVMLGWDLCAYQAYGMDYLDSLDDKGRKGSFVLNWRDQAAQGRYAKNGAKQWLLPGVLYYSLARMGWKSSPVRKTLRQSLGPHAMDKMLALMRLSLMHQMAGIPLDDVYKLVRSLWKRHGDRQVIEPDDIQWLRHSFPNLKIIVSSASPRALLEIVREDFPVHDIFATEIETRNGITSSPHWMHRLFGNKQPRRIAPPASLRQNAYYNKIKYLCLKYPDFPDPDVHTVGITDTKHGEDYPWSEYFKCVADINSHDPFSPLVSTASPLEEIHSAKIMTRQDKEETRDQEDAQPWDMPSPMGPSDVFEFSRQELEKTLEAELTRAEAMAKECYDAVPGVLQDLDDFSQDVFVTAQALENTVIGYNASHGEDRNRYFDKVRAVLKQTYRLNRHLNQGMNPVSQKWSGIEKIMESARTRIHKMAGSAIEDPTPPAFTDEDFTFPVKTPHRPYRP